MWTNTDDAVLATVDAIKSICQTLIVKKVATADELSRPFEHMGQTYLDKKNPDGAAVMSLLLDYLGRRDAAERLMRMPPKGSA